jgi:hypothetical protein
MQTSERPQVNFHVARHYLVSLGEYHNVTYSVLYITHTWLLPFVAWHIVPAPDNR